MGVDLTNAVRSVARRWWPELLVALLASCISLAALGSLELWGKREQRAAAEALDTIRNGHWLVAEIQGRPRLEKPPLPRWTIAAFMTLTGSRDEWAVRMPGALSGLATVALIYALGFRIGGRALGLASAMVLCTLGLFISEVRQAGNDGPLGLFTTLALYAAWRRLHGLDRTARRLAEEPGDSPPGRQSWTLVFHGALGLGFLCKGPIIVLIVGMTVIPYLATIGRLRSGLRQLASPLGLLLFVVLALCWPVPVLLNDPHALGVWMNEIGQKTGILPIPHQERAILGLALPLLALPWPVVAVAGLVQPFDASRRARLPWRASAVWFPWWWAVGNLAVFSLWAVAKPNYYVPCLPGLALLVGMAWIRLSRAARDRSQPVRAGRARVVLWLQGFLLILSGIAVPLLGRSYLTTGNSPWLLVIAGSVSGGVAAGAWIWRRGSDVLALLPIMAACAIAVVIGYGIVAPADNPARGHRRLAQTLERLVPPETTAIRFFHEIDEGLWFYLHDHRLAPVPGSQPRYSDSYDKVGHLLGISLPLGASTNSPVRLIDHQRQVLKDWLRCERAGEPYLLMRSPLYDHLAPDLEGLATPLHRESAMKRNGLVLLQVPRHHSALDVARSERRDQAR